MGFGKWLGHEGSDLVNPLLESSFMVVLGRSGDLCDGVWLAELVSGDLLRGAVVVPVHFLSLFVAMETLAQTTPLTVYHDVLPHSLQNMG